MADFLGMHIEGDYAAAFDQLAETIKDQVSRSGAHGMSIVFQEEAKTFAPVFHLGPKGGGAGKVKRGKIKPGQLRDSIYRVHSDDKSVDGVQLYEVSWNHTKAPHGYWMEYGNARHPAHPFITPAYEAAKQRALIAGLQRMSVRYAESAASGDAK